MALVLLCLLLLAVFCNICVTGHRVFEYRIQTQTQPHTSRSLGEELVTEGVFQHSFLRNHKKVQFLLDTSSSLSLLTASQTDCRSFSSQFNCVECKTYFENKPKYIAECRSDGCHFMEKGNPLHNGTLSKTNACFQDCALQQNFIKDVTFGCVDHLAHSVLGLKYEKSSSNSMYNILKSYPSYKMNYCDEKLSIGLTPLYINNNNDDDNNNNIWSDLSDAGHVVLDGIYVNSSLDSETPFVLSDIKLVIDSTKFYSYVSMNILNYIQNSLISYCLDSSSCSYTAISDLLCFSTKLIDTFPTLTLQFHRQHHVNIKPAFYLSSNNCVSILPIKDSKESSFIIGTGLAQGLDMFFDFKENRASIVRCLNNPVKERYEENNKLELKEAVAIKAFVGGVLSCAICLVIYYCACRKKSSFIKYQELSNNHNGHAELELPSMDVDDMDEFNIHGNQYQIGSQSSDEDGDTSGDENDSDLLRQAERILSMSSSRQDKADSIDLMQM